MVFKFPEVCDLLSYDYTRLNNLVYHSDLTGEFRKGSLAARSFRSDEVGIIIFAALLSEQGLAPRAIQKHVGTLERACLRSDELAKSGKSASVSMLLRKDPAEDLILIKGELLEQSGIFMPLDNILAKMGDLLEQSKRGSSHPN